MACHGSFLQQSIPLTWYVIMPLHTVNFGVSLFMFHNLLCWLATPNPAAMSVHDTVQMECWPIIEIRRFPESLITPNFPQHIQASSYSQCRLVWCAAKDAVCTHVRSLCTSWAVDWGNCSCLHAVRVSVNGRSRNVCLMRSSALLDVLARPDRYWCFQFIMGVHQTS
jgi:hypothetical protein